MSCYSNSPIAGQGTDHAPVVTCYVWQIVQCTGAMAVKRAGMALPATIAENWSRLIARGDRPL